MTTAIIEKSKILLEKIPYVKCLGIDCYEEEIEDCKDRIDDSLSALYRADLIDANTYDFINDEIGDYCRKLISIANKKN